MARAGAVPRTAVDRVTVRPAGAVESAGIHGGAEGLEPPVEPSEGQRRGIGRGAGKNYGSRPATSGVAQARRFRAAVTGSGQCDRLSRFGPEGCIAPLRAILAGRRLPAFPH